MLYVHRSDRADTLVAQLAELVAAPLPDPIEQEVVSVPTRGIERWLTQRLAGHLGARDGRHDGVCANIDFPFPGVLVNHALASAAQADPDADPWTPERAVWPLMELVEAHFDEEWLRPLAEHIRKSRTVEESKRFSSIRHVANLFDRYAVHRPDMLQRWADGTPQLGEAPEEAAWQMVLWLRLRERIGTPSPAERLREACQKLRQDRGLVDLPDRVSMFGLTRLPASYFDVLEALGARRDVHLFLLHPSPALWDRMQPEVGPASRQLLRREDPTSSMPHNPLLASWGRDAREMQLVLGGAVATGVATAHEPPGPRTLLRQIQDDVRADRLPAGDREHDGASDPRPLLSQGDDSIRIHSCHGRSRQVEVLRDAILHELEADPDLELRDVIVMCPDIENFAPLIEATFGARDLGEREDATSQLQIRLADRSLRMTNPLMGVLVEVLELAGARVTATQVIDLAGREPVRRRFRFSDDDLTRMEEWVREARVRWGFDAEHREAFQLGGIGANTWRSGLDRILLGVAMADERERLFSGTAPLDDVDAGDIELAGRLAEFVERLRSAIDDLAPLRTVDEWAKTIGGISDSLSMPASQDAWQRSQLHALLEDVVNEATSERGLSPVVLSCDDVRSILDQRLKGQPTRANFRTGHLTVCTLVPMRSIPHKVVCLLGLDDGSFPRHIERDGDDLTAEDPRVGDRDVRSEDRQLLLDAILAARERLIITYAGHDERSNLQRPPAVPVGELLDVIDRSVRVDGGPARQVIRVTHPLQPFDARNYEPGELVAGKPWSFDTVHLDGARAAKEPRQPPTPFLSRTLPERTGPVRLDLLERFVQNPVRVFVRERLGISFFDRTRDFEDAIPIELDGLSEWDVGERILGARLRGADWASCRAAEIARGGLPPGNLAEPLLADMELDVEALVRASAEIDGNAARSLAVELELSGLPVLFGDVQGVQGDVVHLATYRRMQPALRLRAWVQLLSVTAAEPERPFSAVTIGRAEKSSRRSVCVARIAPLGPDPDSRKLNAETQLRSLLEMFELGMAQPLPLYCKTSAAYAQARATGADDAEVAARPKWETSGDYDQEDNDRAHLVVLGGQLSYNDMVSCSGSLGDEERSRTFDPPERTRFGYYARLLWGALLEYEQLDYR